MTNRVEELLPCARCRRISELLACSVTGGVHFAVEPELSSIDVTFGKRDEAGEMSRILCEIHPLDDEGCFLHRQPLPPRTAISPDGVEERGWQPIETAPKDATVVDLWTSDNRRIPDAWWNASSRRWNADLGPHEPYELPGYPTHWRPLPEPPAISAEGDE